MADTHTNAPPPRPAMTGIAALARLKAGTRFSRQRRSNSLELGVLDLRAHAEATDQVDHRLQLVDALHHAGRLGRVQQVRVHQGRAVGRLAMAVDHGHLVAGPHQLAYDRDTQATGSTRYENAHAREPIPA